MKLKKGRARRHREKLRRRMYVLLDVLLEASVRQGEERLRHHSISEARFYAAAESSGWWYA